MDEALVRRLWLAGSWPLGALWTTDGRQLQIVFPGRPGHGAGPDLLDAIVALPDASLRRGDVELHVRASDWRAHGHTADRRYANVALHVVWRDDLAEPVALPEGADPPLTIALAELPEALLFERLRRPHAIRQEYHEWLARLDEAERGVFLDRLGDERLAAKAARIAADLHALGPAEAVHRALLDALGYSQNRDAFASFAELVPAALLRAVAKGQGCRPRSDNRDSHGREGLHEAAAAEWDCLGLLFGAAGLVAEPRLARVRGDDGRAVADAYRARAAELGVREALKPGVWELIGVRPANRPTRRLAALARLAATFAAEPLDELVLQVLGCPEPSLAMRGLLDLVRVPGVVGSPEAPRPADFWAWHHDFGRRLPGAPLALIGEDRARAIVTNVLLPFGLAVADAFGDAGLEARVRAAWAAAPAGAPNWIIAEMRPVLGRVSLSKARREQGAIELYRRCCEERRCATCPSGSARALVSSRSV